MLVVPSWYWWFVQFGTKVQFGSNAVLVLAICSGWFLGSNWRWACLGDLFRLVPQFNLLVRLSWCLLFVQVGFSVHFVAGAVLVLAFWYTDCCKES